MARTLGAARGALVYAVGAGGLGQAAGIMPLDVVTALNGEATGSAAALLAAVDRLSGPPATVTVWRSGRPRDLTPGLAAAGAPQPGVCAAYVVYSRPDDASGLVSGPWAVDDPLDRTAAARLLDQFAAYAQTVDPMVNAQAMNRRGCEAGEGTGGVSCYAAAGRFGEAGFGAIECANDLEKITSFNGRDLDWRPPSAR